MMRMSKPKEVAIDTLIGENTIVEGKVICKASLRVEGQVKGDILCEGDVVIGSSGFVQSDISARNVTVAGTVEGSIQASELLSLNASGRIGGNLQAKELQIQRGGIFHGISEMDYPPESKRFRKDQEERSEASGKGKDGRLEKMA